MNYKGPVRHQGKVMAKYDCKELGRHLNLEMWILKQCFHLYECQKETVELLMSSWTWNDDDTWAARVKKLLVDC